MDTSKHTTNGGGNNTNHSYQLSSYLLPFRSLTYLYLQLSTIIAISDSKSKRYFMEITGSFIGQHWNKLDRSIELCVTPLDFVRLIHELISLSSSSSTTALPVSSIENNHLSFDVKLRNPSLDELNELLNHMESSSLLIPFSTSSSTTSTPFPTISIECELRYNKGPAEVLRVQSLERDMNNRIKSRNYINMSSFTISIRDHFT
jgi:hypothetical protein